MIKLKNKKALNFRGHIVFSLLMVLMVWSFAIRFVELGVILSYGSYLIPFILGSVFIDKIEKPTSRWHRGILHSRKMFWITLFVLIPATINLGMVSSEKWFFLTAFLIGHECHLIGDWLTSDLPA
jgi:hypothetical protein